MKYYKGFNKDMTCRGFQFEEGKEYTHEGEVKCCKSGFHACEHPLDVFKYYEPYKSVYHEVELTDVIKDDESTDSKAAGKTIKIGAELSIAKLVQASIDFVSSKTDKTKTANQDYGASSVTGNYGASSATGDRGASSVTGNYGASSATGDCGVAVTTGYKSTAISGNKTALAVAWGENSSAKGVLGSYLVLTEWDNDELLYVKLVQVDGEKIKEDTLYKLEKGKIKQC